MPDVDTRTAEITIKRQTKDGWKEFTATASVDVEGEGEDAVYDPVSYSVPDQADILLTDEEKDQLDNALGIPAGQVDALEEEDFEDANPEDELEEDDLEEEEEEKEEERKHSKD